MPPFVCCALWAGHECLRLGKDPVVTESRFGSTAVGQERLSVHVCFQVRFAFRIAAEIDF